MMERKSIENAREEAEELLGDEEDRKNAPETVAQQLWDIAGYMEKMTAEERKEVKDTLQKYLDDPQNNVSDAGTFRSIVGGLRDAII
jgi:hypothetical protein